MDSTTLRPSWGRNTRTFLADKQRNIEQTLSVGILIIHNDTIVKDLAPISQKKLEVKSQT